MTGVLELALLYGLAYRLTRLAGWDDLTHPLRVVITGLGDSQHHELAGYVDRCLDRGVDPWDKFVGNEAPPISRRRFYFSKLIRCPWCIGFWISLAVAAGAAVCGIVAWGWVPALAGTLSLAVGLTAKHFD